MQLNTVEIDSAEIAFGDLKALNGLNLSVPQGSIFGLIGPNGAGKTTTINCITDLLDIDAGTIKIFGKDLNDHGLFIKRKMGALYENTDDLFLYLTGEEYLQFTGEVYGLDKNTITERSNLLLEYWELNSYRYMLINEYSKGMRKKISLASILLHNPDLIIMDEPFDGLDALSVNKLKQLIKRLREKGKTVLITSHILSYIEDLTDEVAILHKGKVVFQSPTSEMRTKAKNELSNEKYNSLEEIFLDLTSTNKNGNQEGLYWLE